MVVPVGEEMKRVPVLTNDHLKVLAQLNNGMDITRLSGDAKNMKLFTDLLELGWVNLHAPRH